ncbi:MAG: Rrf2 family transcriptional regulator [Alphaproteobacteria bacterium]|nr:Rrf2 family transcriptional regulator [Alphaproteobacteria bacterium]
MMYPSRKCQLALDAVLYIAYHSAARPVSSKEVSAAIGFPVRYLEQIMQRLVHENILRGVRGPRGGYVLAKDRRKISLGDICAVVNDNDNEPEPVGSPLGRAILRPVWESAGHYLQKELASITLDELCRKAQEVDSKEPGIAQRADFTI